ncbi:MAG: UDP-N-acetylmuramoyl-tripeptide--D-alanyl-D-alanine ligase [Chloroflexota bacterium]
MPQPTMPRAGRAAPANGARADSLLAADLVALSGGHLVRDSHRAISGASVDSRRVRPGELFVALPGERTDGHRFLTEAVIAGAAAVLVSVAPDPMTLASLGDVTIVSAADPLAALHAISAGWRARFTPLVVGVTGSVGKTSAKEAIATVLSARGQTLRTEGNENNEIGLPLTLLRMSRDDVHAVVEMGMYTGGEITQLARMAQPHVGVVTSIQGVHLSRIGSLEAITNAKAELVEALPGDGVAVLNADDPRVLGLARRTAARVITYGFAKSADVRVQRVRSLGVRGMRFQLRFASPPAAGTEPVTIPALGRLSVHNAAAAAAVGVAVGMQPGEIAQALAGGWSAPHRAQLVRAGDLTIIDDSYNASPASMTAALELLGGLPGRRIAVLGEMFELGDASEDGHRVVGGSAAAKADLLVTVGVGATMIANGAREAGMSPAAVVETEDRAAALATLQLLLEPGDVILVKASRGVELDRLVDALVAAPV